MSILSPKITFFDLEDMFESNRVVVFTCCNFISVQAQWQQDLSGLDQWGGSPARHLNAEGWQHEGGLQAILCWPAEGVVLVTGQLVFILGECHPLPFVFSVRLRKYSKSTTMGSCGMSIWATSWPVPPTWALVYVVASMSSCPSWAHIQSLRKSWPDCVCRSVAQVHITHWAQCRFTSSMP